MLDIREICLMLFCMVGSCFVIVGVYLQLKAFEANVMLLKRKFIVVVKDNHVFKCREVERARICSLILERRFC